MTSQIFKQFAAIVVFVFVGVVNINAQQANADDMLQLIAKLQRLEAMQPDSVGPKYQLALQSLNYAVMNPHAPQTENVLAQAEETISKMENEGCRSKRPMHPSWFSLYGTHCSESRSERPALLHGRITELRKGSSP